MAQVGNGQPARNELIERYQSLNHLLIRKLASRWRLQEADCQDLEQDSVFWILETIRRYRPEEHLKVAGCRFRSFLTRVVTARFIDALRLRRRRCNRILLHAQLKQINRCVPEPLVEKQEPRQQLEGRELQALLQKKLEQLGKEAREMWNLLTQGMTLRVIADRLHISYDAAKRRRRQLFAKLRFTLKSGNRQ
jgi:RNA polymerase sigma factor (sigma-70 family)